MSRTDPDLEQMIMQKFLSGTVAFALLVASLPAAAASATVTRAWQFKPESVKGLEVRNLIGDIRVDAAPSPACTSRRAPR